MHFPLDILNFQDQQRAEFCAVRPIKVDKMYLLFCIMLPYLLSNMSCFLEHNCYVHKREGTFSVMSFKPLIYIAVIFNF